MAAPASLMGRQTIGAETVGDVATNNSFTLVTYNVLADCHVQRGDYSYTAKENTSADKRNEMVLQELRFLDADVVCLQEVSPVAFTAVFEKELTNSGYKAFYIKRTSDLYEEGCATFYRMEKFNCIRSETCRLGELAQLNIMNCELSEADAEKARARYADTPEVAIFTVLESVSTGALVTIANTHVAFTDMLKPDVQSLQIASVRQRLAEISPSGAHVICGDFNVFPDTPPYILATNGCLGKDQVTEVCGEAKLEEAGLVSSFTSLLTRLMDPGSPMRSAYKEIMGTEPEVTCVDNIWRCTLDYVFYRTTSANGKTDPRSGQLTSSRLAPLEVLNTHSQTEILKAIPPSHVYPSDHMPLRVKFQLSCA